MDGKADLVMSSTSFTGIRSKHHLLSVMGLCRMEGGDAMVVQRLISREVARSSEIMRLRSGLRGWVVFKVDSHLGRYCKRRGSWAKVSHKILERKVFKKVK